MKRGNGEAKGIMERRERKDAKIRLEK